MELLEIDEVRKMYFDLKRFCEERKLKNSLRAIPYAMKMHNGVTRIGGEPYITHPFAMALLSIQLGVNNDAEIAATILHDVPEDCHTDMCDLDIDPFIKDITQRLNVHNYESDQWDKHERNRLYYDEIKKYEIDTMIKLLDNFHNLSTMLGVFPPTRIQKNVNEKKEFVYPLIDYAEKNYAKTLERRKQLAYLKNGIYTLVTQLENSLDTPETGVVRKRFIA